MANCAHNTPRKSPPVTVITSCRTAVATALLALSGVTAARAAAGGMVAIPPSVDRASPARPDAELIAIGAEAKLLAEQWHSLLKTWWTLKVESADLEPLGSEMQVPHDRLCDLADRAVALRASTLEGMQAKAILLQHAFRVECEEEDGEMQMDADQKLVWSLLCDMTGRA
jgi:hypothetical protein